MRVTFTKEDLEIIKAKKEAFILDNKIEPNILILPKNHWTLDNDGARNTLIKYWDGMLVVVDASNETIRCALGQLTDDEKINVKASREHFNSMSIEVSQKPYNPFIKETQVDILLKKQVDLENKYTTLASENQLLKRKMEELSGLVEELIIVDINRLKLRKQKKRKMPYKGIHLVWGAEYRSLRYALSSRVIKKFLPKQ